MKSRINRLITVCLCVLFSNIIVAQDEIDKYPETVVIRVIEVYGNIISSKGEPRMVVCKPDLTVETIPLERISSALTDTEDVILNLKKLRQQIQIWHNKGFQVKTHTTGDAETAVMESTIILQKN